MLSTLALFLLYFVLISKKKKQLYLDISFVQRDYKYFLFAYFIAILFSFKFLNSFKIIACLLLLLLYIIFVYRTILKSRTTCVECESDELYLKIKNEKLALICQLLFSLVAILV
jgi:hypothetical protein